jgi:hypothetical protein
MALVGFHTPAAGQTMTWPQQLTDPEGTIDIYQPQFETFKGNAVTGRAAVGLTAPGTQTPVFGAFWFSAVADVDQAADQVTLREIKVTNVRWPNMTPALEQRFKEVVGASVPIAGLHLSYEAFSASLATAEREKKSMAELKNDPPAIMFTKDLAVLLLFDGEPRFKDIENSPYERAMNTPLAVVREKKSGTCYLTSGALWYTAKAPLGPWEVTKNPPADLVQNMPKDESGELAPKVSPRIIAASVPTEVISTDGEPSWKSLPGGKLLYVENTETPWVRELESQQIYILLSGRWFRAKTTDGPWAFVRADQLPASFKEVPAGSDLGGIRSSVAGTEEADDAVLDAEIPQTTAIKRDEAKFESQYDGSPKFEQIPGTSVSYATNTGAQIIQVGNKYYAADNGVWFVATSPSGPWTVASEVPEQQIQQIPPSSPVYNVTHLHVYQSTPSMVYMGYTPGYMWSFPYYGVPVYGTGFYYPPFYGAFYYPRPPTWGFHVGYNPWTGWNFGVSWGGPFMRVGVGWNSGWGSWGGGYRRYGCCGGYHSHYSYNRSTNININNRVSVGNSYNSNRLRTTNVRNASRDNIYNRPENRSRNVDRAQAAGQLKNTRPAAGKANNVFADRDGNIARKTQQGWEAKGQKGWEKPEAEGIRDKADSIDKRPAGAVAGSREKPEAAGVAQKIDSKDIKKPSGAGGNVNAGQARQRVDSADLNRSAAARDRGATRTASRPPQTRSKPAAKPASRPAAKPATKPAVPQRKK